MRPKLRSILARFVLCSLCLFVLVMQPILRVIAQDLAPQTQPEFTPLDTTLTDVLLVNVGDIPTGLTTTPMAAC